MRMKEWGPGGKRLAGSDWRFRADGERAIAASARPAGGFAKVFANEFSLTSGGKSMRCLLCGFLSSLLLVAVAAATAAATERAEACSVTGLVTDHRGAPVPHAIISLFRDGEENKVLVTASSDRSGKFFLSRLSPGVYRFLATARGFQTLISERAELLPGRPAHVSFTLRPAPDAKAFGINPVKYQNRRNRGIFNAAPAADSAAAADWRVTALVGSSGYDAQVSVEVSPELEVGALLRRDWEGQATAIGGALRYAPDRHRLMIRATSSQAISAPRAPGEASPGEPALGAARRYELRVADAWQATPTLQLAYGFDYVQVGRASEDAWLPRLAARWQPCASLQAHAALTPDGQAAPDWTAPEQPLFASDFPTPPALLAADENGPALARHLRAEAGLAWRLSPKAAVSVFVYQDRLEGHALALEEQPVERVDGRAQGSGLVVAYHPHRRLTITTAYALGRAPAGARAADAARPMTTYQVVAVVAEMAFPARGARLAIGYRGATGNPIQAIDPFAARLPFTDSGLSFAFAQAIPSWLAPLGRWEAIIEGRNLDERRGELAGLGAMFGFPQRRIVRGGLRMRF
ncbi:MAG: hypothetical protein CFK52_13020 [Chloracidobacterium sp. CP2_5A]|nr:MAG: hypothetical protein CFK52_13020 [Chloracidobacterium sp. CP2_5A]